MVDNINNISLLINRLSHIGVFEYNLNTKTSWASNQLFTLLGFDYIPETNPILDSKCLPEETLSKLMDLLNSKKPFNFDFCCECTVNPKYFTIVGNPVTVNGNIDSIICTVVEMTNEKLKELSQYEFETNFKKAIENSAVPMMLTTEDGEVLIVNDKIIEVTGYKKEDINTSQKWFKLAHRSREEFNADFVKDLFENGITINGQEEPVYTIDDKKLIWAFHNSSLGRLYDGRKAMMTVCIDVTKERESQEMLEKALSKLHKSETYLKAALESQKGFVIILVDNDYNYLHFNEMHKNTMKSIYDIDIEIGMNLLDCITLKEDREKEKQRYDRALAGESYSIIDKYGEENAEYFETFYNPIIDKDEIEGISIFTHNITSKMNELTRIQESEEKFRLIYSSMSQGLAVHNVKVSKDGKVLDLSYEEVNESYLKLFEYKRENLIGKSVKQVAPGIEDYWIQSLGGVGVNGEPKYFENYSREAGKYLSTYSYQTKQNQVAVLISDITERIQREKQIEYLSYNDPLTGVYNRRFYEEKFIELDKEENLPLSLIMGDVNGLKLVNDSFGHLIGDKLLIKVADIMKRSTRSSDFINRIGGDEFVIILPKTDKTIARKIIDRINTIAKEETIESIDISISFGYDTKTSIEQSLLDIFKKVEDEMYSNKLNEGNSMRSKTIDLIMTTLYENNEREMNHSKRVSKLSEKLAQELGLSKDAVNQARTAGLMHDIGKIGISDKILNKKGYLTLNELNEIRKHSEVGYRILTSLSEFSDIANFILHHHERIDGQGYPSGLTGDEIPLMSKIICICDAYDAMTGPRTYKKAFSMEEAKEELLNNAGSQFDEKLVDVFINKVL